MVYDTISSVCIGGCMMQFLLMYDTISCFCLGWSGASPPGRKAGGGAQVPDPGEPQHQVLLREV